MTATDLHLPTDALAGRIAELRRTDPQFRAAQPDPGVLAAAQLPRLRLSEILDIFMRGYFDRSLLGSGPGWFSPTPRPRPWRSVSATTARQVGIALGTAVIILLSQTTIDLPTVRHGWLFLAASATISAMVAGGAAIYWHDYGTSAKRFARRPWPVPT